MKSGLFSLLLLALFVSVFLFPSFAPTQATSPKVYILEDGQVQGTSSIQRNGDIYTLIADIRGSFIVLKDGIVIDGAGYTVTGADGRGIVLSQRHDVTVKNTRVTLDGGYLIDVEGAADCMLIENTLFGSPIGGVIAINFLHSQRISVKNNVITNFFEGIALEESKGHTITGNTLTNGILGISIEKTSDCVFRNNKLRNCSFSTSTFRGNNLVNDLDTSNTVNGQPIYYWVNTKDQTISSNAAYIVLVKCTNITVKDSSPQGICIVSADDCVISNVKLGKVTTNQRGDGIYLLDSSRINITDSVVQDKGIAIKIENSSNIIISDNNISRQITQGINLVNAENTVILANIFTDNSIGIGSAPYSLSSGPVVGTTVALNNFTGNSYAVSVCGDMKIHNNFFDNNDVGIIFSEYTNNIVTENTFSHNKHALYFSNSSGNSIYLNNFLKNEHQVTDAGVNNTFTQPTKVSPSSSSVQTVVSRVKEVNFMPPPPPSHNQYDNGTRGNYWIDYIGSDINRDGVGDTAYYVYANNQDNHPLMTPVDIGNANIELPNWSTSPSNSPSEPQTSELKGQEPFSILIAIIASAVVIIMLIAGLLAYTKHQREVTHA